MMRGICALVLVLACAQPAFAQKDIEFVIGDKDEDGDGEKDLAVTVNSLKIDLNAPTAAAGAIIRADDIALTSVRTMSDLQTQLLSGFDENGVLQTGVALTGAPYMWFNPILTADDYAADSDTLIGLLRRTQFALATKQLPDDGENAIGVGMSLSWQLNSNNELAHATDAIGCLQDKLVAELPVLQERTRRADVGGLRKLKADNAAKFGWLDPERGIDNVEITREQATAMGVGAANLPTTGGTLQLSFAIEAAGLKTQFEDAKEAAFNSPEEIANYAVEADRSDCDEEFETYLKKQDSWVLTVAQGFRSDTGKYDDLDSDKSAIYLQYRSGSENSISKTLGVPLIGLLSYVTDETVRISDTVEEKADRFIVGLGSAAEGDGYALDFQVSLAKSDFQTARPDAEEFKATIAYSKQIATGVWMEFKAGTKSSDDVDGETFAGFSFKLSPSVLGH